MSGKGFVKVNVGDIFNETDDDKTQRVIEVHAERDPPIALCCSVKEENESDETEQEYALEYVENVLKKDVSSDPRGSTTQPSMTFTK